MTEVSVSRKQTKRVSTRAIASTGILAAAAFVLQYVELPALLMPGFIKFDFSDLPALIGAFTLGPVYGVIIKFVRSRRDQQLHSGCGLRRSSRNNLQIE